MSENEKQNNKTNKDLIPKINEEFIPLISLIFKITGTYQQIYLKKLEEMNKIILPLENNLQSINIDMINNLKTILKSCEKTFKGYLTILM